ncbi:MAG TPA: lipoyl synthase, partial [Chloroflexi bacterium]|nr:lipoyl synthase [Chloroflexota bacterium]
MPKTPTRDRVDPAKVNTAPLRRPPWIRVRAPSGETYQQVRTLMRGKSLHTVC